MVDAIVREIRESKYDLAASNPGENAMVDSIYFGGGTPSLLSEDQLKGILDAVFSRFEVAGTAEITLETNPDDHTEARLEGWKLAGINRLSIGVQSFSENDLRWMNRAHNAEQSLQAIRAARNTGFQDLTIDLIYGIPGLADEQWLRHLDMALQLGINHLSCYALTVEPQTALANFIRKATVAPVDPEQQARQFLLLMEWAARAGLEHYEISNFAVPGHRSRHNTAYWQGKPYLGFGPSAHSFDGKARRWWNVANNALYMKAIETGSDRSESETLTAVQQLNEYIMTGIRTIEGIRLSDPRWDAGNRRGAILAINNWERTGKMKFDGDQLRLTNEGKLFADGIAADLFS